MKILVFGAGPLGSLMAARLHEAGQDVTLLARRKRLEDLKKYGVVIEDSVSKEQTITPVKVVETFGPEDEYDLVMVVMRKNQAVEILPTVGANKKVPTFLFMMNNAAGFDKIAKAVGKERVMGGFPYPGGEKNGHIMRIIPIDEHNKYTIPIGEIDGQIRERTLKIAKVLASMRGYKVEIRKDIDVWLKCHVALLMSSLAPALYAADCDMKRLGRTRDLLVLANRGVWEGLRALRKAGIPTRPKMIRIFGWIPEPIMVALLAKMMKKEEMKASVEGHCKSAKDEMKYLADELLTIIRKAGIKTPVIDSMQQYYDDNISLVPEGSKEIPLRWGSIILSLLIIAGIVALLMI